MYENNFGCAGADSSPQTHAAQPVLIDILQLGEN